MSCEVASTAIEGFDGVSVIDSRVGTVIVVDPQMEPVHALMVAVPAATAKALP